MKIYNKFSVVVLIAVFVLSLVGPTSVSAAALAPNLGVAASFSVLSGLSMSAAGPTTVSADLGLSPGLAVSRTGGPWIVGGQEFFGPTSLAATAKTDASAAYTNLITQPSDGTWSLNAAPLPGVWTAADSPVFNGTLTLNGSASDIWVFQLTTDFTFTGNVVLGPGVNPCNVYWAVGQDATINSGGAGTKFVGTLIAGRTVNLVSGVTVNGRILSSILTSGSLTTAGTTTISGCAVGTAPIIGGTRRDSTINVVKTVINDNGGTKTVSDFPLFINGVQVTSGATTNYPVPGGTYTVTETSDPQYTRTFSGDCDTNGQMTLTSGDNKFCIVTNNDVGAPVAPPVPPLIDVIKVPSPLALPNGPGPVTYTYTLRNIGTVPVTDVTMVGDTCSPITLYSGDNNANSILETNETWVYRCSTNLNETHTNIVVATGRANGITATDIATATVVVGAPIVPPLIHVTKVPSPLALSAAGGAVTYTEKITNPGTVALRTMSI